tara:strand:+ start:1523 stop:1804 length:282 start_codon:yes stop_codon:yes gene_type:complete
MIKLTKQMREDLRKAKEQDLVVCDACGSDKISEKIWIDTNSYISVDGETYYKYSDSIDDTMYWCDKCNEEAAPVHISEWEEIIRENEDAKQKS